MEPLSRHHHFYRDPVTEDRGYEAIEDPAELRIAIRELRRVREWISQFGDVIAEMPGFGLEGVRATKATAAMVTLLIERAELRLRRLTANTRTAQVVTEFPVVSPPDASGLAAAG